ncbi:murein biosynthesis integral membrane protein MurJ [Candidatus Uhrbacteria bacterium]|nr:murein biosynthesis integral membrane protein MurJ [Candidatus Uhrbacteria bacterium]
MLKFLNRESKTIIGAATVVGVLSLVSRLVGLMRDRLLAGAFGAGDTLDIYYAAFKIPDLLFTLVVMGALSASFIPLFLSHWSQTETRAKAWHLTNNAVHLIAAAMILLSLTLALFAQPLSELIAPGFALYKQNQVAVFMRVMFLSQILLSVSLVYGSVLQSLKRFFFYALAPIFYNVGIIAGALWFVDGLGTIGLAWGVVFGACLHLLVQLLGLRGIGYRYAWRLRLLDRDTRTMLALMVPRSLGLAVNQLLFVVLGIIATTLPGGSLTIFQFAYNIQFFPVGIIGVSFAIAVFPALSEKMEQHEPDAFVQVLLSTIRQVVYLMAPMTILFLILRAQVVRVVVGAGEFDWDATIAAADTLAFFALTFIPQALIYLFARSFFALRDTTTPLVTGAVAALIGVLVALLLREPFGVASLGIGFAVSALVQAGLLWMLLRSRVGTLRESTILTFLYKVSAASLAGALTMQTVKPAVVALISLETFWGVLLQGLIAGSLGLAAYVLIGGMLRIEEQQQFFASLRRSVFRRSQPSETAPSNPA